VRWVGWYRLNDRSPWVKAAEGDRLDEVASRLSEATRDQKLRNTDEAITTGAVLVIPDRRRRRY
jgi:hypothetical protein